MLESLYLQNFKVFDKCKVDFGNGVAVVVGENGNGKSSLFEAIEFSLFGTIVRKGRKFGSTYAPITDLIQTNKPSARVELLFKSPVNKKTYRVVRSIDRNNRKDDALFLGDRLVSKGTTTVNSTISEILGLGFDAFSAISYVRQGEISELTRKTSGEREKVIDRILNLEIFEKARELANKDKAQYERDRDIIKTKQEELRTGLEADSGRLKEIRKSMSELGPAFKEKDKLYKKMKQEKAISDKIEKFETKESELKKRLGTLEEKKTEKMGRKSEEHKVEANKIRNSIEEVKRDIGHIESNFSERAKSLNSEKSAEMEKAKYRIPSSVIFTFLGTLILTAVLFFASPILALAAFILGILFAAYKIKTVRGDAKNVREIEKKYDKLMRQTEQEKIGQIRSKEGEMASQSRKLEGISKAHQKALSQVEKEEDKTVEELKNEIESIGKEKGSLSKRLSSDDIERDLSVAERDREGCLKEIKKSEGEMDGVAKRIKENKVRLNKTGNEIKSYEYSIERLNIVAEEILKRVPKWVRMRLISVVREETRNIFLKMFGHRYKDIEITSDYNIEVLSPLAREFYPVSMISGGEDTAANISLRLGISKALYRVYTEVRGANAAPGLLIMDEPTTHLDRRRRELLTEVIRTIKDLPQVIISTNIEEVENAADSIIYVNRISPMSNSNIIVKGK